MTAAVAASSPAVPVGSPDDGYPIAPGRRIGAAVAMIAATAMVLIDMTVANVAVPHIAGDLGASLEQGTWVVTSYAIAEAIIMPLTGWLVGRLGAVRLFVFCLAGFTLFSLLCGVSTTLPMLVFFRICQGLCGGPIMPLSQILSYRIFPPRQLQSVMGYWMLCISVAPAIGPILGGSITDQTSWHWIFLVNIPVGIGAAVLSYLLLRPAENAPVRAPVDRTGLVLLLVWVGALQFMLDTGRNKDWFGDASIVVLAIVAAVGCCFFLIWELTDEHPIVNLRLMRKRPFAMCVIGISVGYSSYFSGIIIVPQWLQTVMGYSATQAGMVTATTAIAAIGASQVTLRMMLRLDPRVVATVGGLWSGSCVILRTIWSTDLDMVTLALTFGVQGLGTMMMTMPLNSMAANSLKLDETPAGMGLLNFIRTMSAAMTAAVVLTYWANQQAVARDAIVQAVHPDQAGSALAALGLPVSGQVAYLGHLVDSQAETVAMLHTFGASGLAMLAVALMIWTIPPVELRRLTGGKDQAH